MKKSLLLILGLLWAATTLCGQERWVKLYGNALWARRASLNPDLSDNNHLLLRNRLEAAFLPELALEIHQENRNFWEIGLTGRSNKANDQNLTLTYADNSVRTINVGDTREWDVTAQVSYNYHWREGGRKRYNQYFGWIATASATGFDYEPATSEFYPLRQNRIGLLAGVVPRIQFNLTDRIRLDFNGVLSLLSGTIESETIENPLLTPSQQNGTLFEFGFLSSFQIRVGLAYRL